MSSAFALVLQQVRDLPHYDRLQLCAYCPRIHHKLTACCIPGLSLHYVPYCEAIHLTVRGN